MTTKKIIGVTILISGLIGFGIGFVFVVPIVSLISLAPMIVGASLWGERVDGLGG